MSAVAINNYDLLEDLFDFIKDPNTTIKDVLKEHGGSSFYVPSYKTCARNEDIIKEYKERLGEFDLVKNLSKEFDLSTAQIYSITKEVREPTLF